MPSQYCTNFPEIAQEKIPTLDKKTRLYETGSAVCYTLNNRSVIQDSVILC